MRRRDFITALSIASVWPVSSAASAHSVITQSDRTLFEHASSRVAIDAFKVSNGDLHFCICSLGCLGAACGEQFRKLPAADIATSQTFLAPLDRHSESGTRLQNLFADKHLAFIVGAPADPLERGLMERLCQAAKTAGALTLAVIPSESRDRVPDARALAGSAADSVIEIPTTAFMRTDHRGATPSLAKETAQIVRDIARMVGEPGIVGVDLEDLRAVLGGFTRAVAVAGMGSGPNRAHAAIEEALLAANTYPAEAAGPQRIAVAITGPKDLRIREVSDIMKAINNQCGTSTHVIFGANPRDDAGDVLRVTVLMSRHT